MYYVYASCTLLIALIFFQIFVLEQGTMPMPEFDEHYKEFLIIFCFSFPNTAALSMHNLAVCNIANLLSLNSPFCIEPER